METSRDRSYRGSIAEVIDPLSIIPISVYISKNKAGSWQYRDYTEYDINFICISQDGTLGKIFKVGDLLIGLPSEVGKEILNIDKHPDDAKWGRTKIPADFLSLESKYKSDMNLTKGFRRGDIKKLYNSNKLDLEDKHKKFVDKEIDRRKYGLFIKIDEEIFYLTPENYMFLEYYFLAEDLIYPHFRTTAVYTWYHWEACKFDRRCWGELRLKSRRVAWTVEACSIAINQFTQRPYSRIPIVSERKDLAKILFTEKVVNSFMYYPAYFKPLLDDPNNLAKGSIEIIFHDIENTPNSVIYPCPTKLTAYDSTKANPFGINDEFGKLEEVSATAFRQKHKDCYHKGLGQIVSTGKWGSTAGAFKSGGKEFQYEFEHADATKRDALGKTVTGLIALFVDDCYTTAGKYDAWGYPIVDDPKEAIWCDDVDDPMTEYGAITQWNVEYEKHAKGKALELNAFLREHPRVPEHAFRSEGGVNNDFDIDNLNNHADHLRKFHKEDLTEIIFRGNLVWEGEPYKSDVKWRNNPKGKFFTTWLPDKKIRNKSNQKVFMGKDTRFPSNNHIGCLGVDSYDIIGNVSDGKGSDGAIMGYSKMSMEGCPSHSFFLKYKERPDKRDDFYDDVIKACVYFGFYVLIESNKSRLLEYMWEKGFTGYAMRRQDKRWKDLNHAEKTWGGMPSSLAVIADQANLLKDYIVDYVGNNLEDDCKVYFLDLIEEWTEFNIQKRKKFDLAVASGFAIMGAQYRVKQRRSLDDYKQKGGVTMQSFGA